MKCPACGRELQHEQVSDLVVDVCRNGCGGIWFDNFELRKVDEQHEAAGEELLDIECDESVRVDRSQVRMCPKCDGQKMVKHFMSTKNEIEVDECYRCQGIWLDRGELGSIRKQFATEQERIAAFTEFFAGAIGPELEKMRAESEEQLQRAKRFARMFRFICPSYYIPGNQAWGAF